jgi:hypothetical protein
MAAKRFSLIEVQVKVFGSYRSALPKAKTQSLRRENLIDAVGKGNHFACPSIVVKEDRQRGDVQARHVLPRIDRDSYVFGDHSDCVEDEDVHAVMIPAVLSAEVPIESSRIGRMERRGRVVLKQVVPACIEAFPLFGCTAGHR